VPFEEDDKDSSIWFLDHSYHEQMYRMCRRINGMAFVQTCRCAQHLLALTPHLHSAKEAVVGWYSTGPKVREADLDIHEMIGNYVASPVLVVIDVQPQELGLPTSAYTMVEEVASARTPPGCARLRPLNRGCPGRERKEPQGICASQLRGWCVRG
jgi:26S proteasome regulatory subunit N8